MELVSPSSSSYSEFSQVVVFNFVPIQGAQISSYNSSESCFFALVRFVVAHASY